MSPSSEIPRTCVVLEFGSQNYLEYPIAVEKAGWRRAHRLPDDDIVVADAE